MGSIPAAPMFIFMAAMTLAGMFMPLLAVPEMLKNHAILISYCYFHFYHPFISCI